MTQRFFLMLLSPILLMTDCKKASTPNSASPSQVFIKGIDLSFSPEISQWISFSENGVTNPILAIVKNKGINTVRLRLWNNPSTPHSSMPEVLDFARQVKAQGLKLWLDLHYSDTWADPGQQTKPAAWTTANFSALKDSIYQYTRNSLAQFINNNARPDYIQIGNEINVGFLWNEGKVNDIIDPNWANFADLIKQGVRAVREVSPSTKVILHIAGYDYAAAYFQKLQNFSVDFDIIGLSYYPWWHGLDLDVFKENLRTLDLNFHKPIVIAETAYPFTLQWNDYTNNFVGLSSQLIPGYGATQSGQSKYIADLKSIVKSVSTVDNAGVCYWAGDYVAFKGPVSTNGSPWENLALFDFQYQALPALAELGK